MILNWLAENPAISTLLGVMVGAFLWILFKAAGAKGRIAMRPYGKRVWDEWKAFGELLGEIVWWTIAGSAYLVIGGLIWVFVLRRQDLLRRKHEGSTFWETPKPLEFSLRRHVRQY